MAIEKILSEYEGDYYEGEVKDGMPNGFGTRYVNFRPEYTGDFYDGNAHGLGTMYSPEGNILYEGMFHYDFYHGEGVSYYPNKKKEAEGVFQFDVLVNGKVFSPEGWLLKEGMFGSLGLHGLGKIYNIFGHVECEGIFHQNTLIGIVGTFEENLFLENIGEWQGDVFCLKSNALQVKISFVNGVQHGETVLSEADGQVKDIFTFEQGKLIYHKSYINGRIRCEGEVQEYDLNGHGKIYNCDGTLFYEGGMKKGVRHGRGTTILENGDRLTGEYEHDFHQGEGEVHNQQGRLIYKGHLLDELIDGEGTYYYEDGTYFVGRMSSGFPQKGAYYDATGRVIGQENRNKLDFATISSVQRNHIVN